MKVELLYSPHISVKDAREITPETRNYLQINLPEGNVVNLPIDNSVGIFEISPNEERNLSI